MATEKKLPTLTLNFSIRHSIYFSLKGLSMKATKRTYDFGHDLCRDDADGRYYIHYRFDINGRTSYPEKGAVIKHLKQLYEAIPFGKIKIIGHYELTGQQLYEEVIILKTNE